MKKACAILWAALLLWVAAATADEGAVYTVTSLVSCEQTQPMYSRFYQSGTLSAVVPGLAEGLVPQGIDWLPEEKCLLFAGYRADKGSSALIAVSLETGQIVRQVRLCYADGSAYSGHAGGVCVTERDIYISNAHRLYRISLDTFRSLPGIAECRFEEEIPVPVNASFCCYAQGVLWVGEFQYGTQYKTDVSHRVKTADGTQRAWICGYALAESEGWRIRPEARPAEGDATPDYILSVTERIQGITQKEGAIYLSQSYGRRNGSTLYRYGNVLEKAPDDTAAVNGASVPLWKLDSTVCEDVLFAPPMSECLATVEGSVYVLFESAAQPYVDGAENPMDRVFCLTDF